MNVCACGRGGADVSRLSHAIEYLLTERINRFEVRTHSLHHDLRRDVDHVSMPHMAAIYYVRHLHPAAELIGLHLYGKDAYVRGLHVVENLPWQILQGAWRTLFEHEGIPLTADALQLCGQRCGDLTCLPVCDEGDFLFALNAQAGRNRVASAFAELFSKRYVDQIGIFFLDQKTHPLSLQARTSFGSHVIYDRVQIVGLAKDA